MTIFRSRLLQAFYREPTVAVVQRTWPEHGPAVFSVMATGSTMHEADRKCEQWIRDNIPKQKGALAGLARLEEAIEDLQTSFDAMRASLID